MSLPRGRGRPGGFGNGDLPASGPRCSSGRLSLPVVVSFACLCHWFITILAGYELIHAHLKPPILMPKRLKRWLLGLALLSFAWADVVCFRIVQFGALDQHQRSDCIIVLGAAVHAGGPSLVYRERIRHGVDLYNRGVASSLVFTGGVGAGAMIAESECARTMAIAMGVPASAIQTEIRSRTTLQNLTEAQAIMAQRGWRSAVIVSDPYHMLRACEMAQDMGIIAQSSPTPTTRYRSVSTRFSFLVREFYFIHHYFLFGQ